MKLTSVTTDGPCWVELGTTDPVAARAFYRELFGWREDDAARPADGDYVQMLLEDTPVAAISPRYGPRQPTAWTVSFAVADADATAARVEKAGGSLLKEPTDVLDHGRFAVAADPSHAVFILWQARTFKGAGVFNEPGSLGWVELVTRDPSGALAFYPAVFDWSVSPSDYYTQWGVAGQDFGGMPMTDDRSPEAPSYWLPYFSCADADLTVSRAVALGADVLVPASGMPGGRRTAVLRDPQGAAFAVYHAPPVG
ncbi:VOC family protein [Kitasatospora sp. NPDC093550]|uniref:VOC family protein n=1 Tax=Kitasatospora sp. NPDC093550 TaxID=3364089 RepID=UPI003825826E